VRAFSILLHPGSQYRKMSHFLGGVMRLVWPVIYFALVATAGAAEGTTAVHRGEQLVTKNCTPCHAVGRAGASRHPEAPPFRTLAERYPIESLEEALAEGIVSGHPDMPEFRFAAGNPPVSAAVYARRGHL
jgi:cytochrome c